MLSHIAMTDSIQHRDDVAMIAAHRAGDPLASRALGEIILDVCERVASRFKQLSPTDKREMVAGAATLAVRKLHLYRGTSKLTTWLFTLALNCSRMFLRNTGYRRVRRMLGATGNEIYEIETADSVVGSPDPESLYVRAEQADVLGRALRHVGPDDIYAIRRRYSDDVDLTTIATELGLCEPTLRTRMARARAILRERIAEEEPERLS